MQIQVPTEAIQNASKIALNSLRPPPKLTIDEWADTYRILSSEASAEAGKFNTSRAEYQREIMRCFTDYDTEKIVIKKFLKLNLI